jgi:LmbE family N-acetylglucosaminyl deacetylase
MKKVILTIGAHPDDVELHCTGSLLRFKKRGWKVFSLVCTEGKAGGENRQKEQQKVWDMMGIEGEFLNYDDGELSHNRRLVTSLDLVIGAIKPDIILTHSLWDLHNDHLAVANAVRSANRLFSSSLISFPHQYTIQKPMPINMYINISEYWERKMHILTEFKTQAGKIYFSPDTIMARHTGTGMAKYVEKFYIEFLKV